MSAAALPCSVATVLDAFHDTRVELARLAQAAMRLTLNPRVSEGVKEAERMRIADLQLGLLQRYHRTRTRAVMSLPAQERDVATLLSCLVVPYVPLHGREPSQIRSALREVEAAMRTCSALEHEVKQRVLDDLAASAEVLKAALQGEAEPPRFTSKGPGAPSLHT